MIPAESERQFDDLLRHKLAADEEQPSVALWPALSATLPAAPRPWQPVGAAALLGVVLGLLIGWWAGVRSLEKGPQDAGNATGNAMMTTRSQTTANRTAKKVGGSLTTATESDMKVGGTAATQGGSPTVLPGVAVGLTGGGSPLSGTASPAAADSAERATDRSDRLWQVALAQDSALRHAGPTVVVPSRADSAGRVLGLIAAQRHALGLLQHRLDSLKAALPAEPPVLTAVADSATLPAPAMPAPTGWSFGLLTEATTPWGVLPSVVPDTRQTLGAFFSRQAQLAYQAGRWRVRGGFGETRASGQFRGMSERTGQTQVSDTLSATTVEVVSSMDTTYLIHFSTSLQLNPRINGSGQIIAYDSVWIPRYDTLYQIVVAHDTVQRTTQTVTTRLETWRERREQQLRPTYRFWTVPLAVQVDLLRAGRWVAGLSVGSQLTIFRGSEQPTRRTDGAYELRRTGPRDGPFRPVSLALTTALEVRYRLGERLSLQAGVGGRGWAVSPVRGESRVRLQPTAQLGLSWRLSGR